MGTIADKSECWRLRPTIHAKNQPKCNIEGKIENINGEQLISKQSNNYNFLKGCQFEDRFE